MMQSGLGVLEQSLEHIWIGAEGSIGVVLLNARIRTWVKEELQEYQGTYRWVCMVWVCTVHDYDVFMSSFRFRMETFRIGGSGLS